jgi:hypothetical protein
MGFANNDGIIDSDEKVFYDHSRGFGLRGLANHWVKYCRDFYIMDQCYIPEHFVGPLYLEPVTQTVQYIQLPAQAESPQGGDVHGVNGNKIYLPCHR